MKSFGRKFDTYGEPFGFEDTIGCYINLDNGFVKFSKNGTFLFFFYFLLNES